MNQLNALSNRVEYYDRVQKFIYKGLSTTATR
jgi:hypothetical protein